MKRLRVKTQNSQCCVEFGELVHVQEEPIAVNLARLKSAAANFGFRIKCTNNDCDLGKP